MLELETKIKKKILNNINLHEKTKKDDVRTVRNYFYMVSYIISHGIK